jgi:hypothetical protein
MNYTELKETIQDYCENTFTNAQLATFTEQAEQKIYNSVQISALRKNATSNCTIGNSYITAPQDYLSVFSFAVIDPVDGYQYMLNKDVNYIREAYPKPTDTGLPLYYAFFDQNTFIIGPTPDDTVELHYFYYPESIVTAGTTWLGNEFDSALLNGALVEAITFMKGEDDLVKLYLERYNAAMDLLKNLGDAKQRMDAYRDGQLRLPVR